MDPFRLIVLIVVGGTIAAFGGWIVFNMIRGAVRYYRDHKPRPMATPCNDSRSSIQQFQRIMGQK